MLNPMAELLKGSLTLATVPGEPMTLDTLKDMHTRALMLAIPTHATIVAVQFVELPDSHQELTIHWRVQTPAPHAELPQSPEAHQGRDPYAHTAPHQEETPS